MVLGRRNTEQQPSFWIAVDDLPRSEGHVFYGKLNQLLREAGFDAFVERLCEPYYHDTMGRPGIPPGVYFDLYFAPIIIWTALERLLTPPSRTDRQKPTANYSFAMAA